MNRRARCIRRPSDGEGCRRSCLNDSSHMWCRCYNPSRCCIRRCRCRSDCGCAGATIPDSAERYSSTMISACGFHYHCCCCRCCCCCYDYYYYCYYCCDYDDWWCCCYSFAFCLTEDVHFRHHHHQRDEHFHRSGR